jgi:hypothetical protein
MKYTTVCAAIAVAAAGILGCSSDAPDAALSVTMSAMSAMSDEADLKVGADIDTKKNNADEDDDEPPPVDAARELLIKHISVVEDPVRTKWPVGQPAGPQAAWTFGRLMEKMAGGQDASQFCLEWLEQWETDQVVNGYTVLARPAIKELVIDPWLAASGGQTLDLRIAPFRLLAIVNRLDLRYKEANGKIWAGEGRFVFGLVDPEGAPLPFTIIFEYGVKAENAVAVKKWAKAWHELGKTPFGPAYNAKLQLLTDKFANPICTGRPNNSCINQIRTNEVALDPVKVWELREFRLSAQTGKLVPSPMIQTPDLSLNGTDALATFINANADLAKQRKHVIDPSMLAAAAPGSLTTFWDAPGILDNEARHGLALSTCNGCHTVETGSKFLHVKNRAAGAESNLSAYMTGTTVTDPVSGVTRTFNELAGRVQDMQTVLISEPDDIFESPIDDDDDDDD